MTIDAFFHKPNVSLDTAIVELARPENPKKVKLVGASHVGMQQYYQELMRELASSDVVLYEFVLVSEGVSWLNTPIISSAAGLTRKTAIALNKRYDSTCERIEASLKNETTQAEQEECLRVLRECRQKDRVCSQFDGIPYQKLPLSWKRADSTLCDVARHFGVFSKPTVSLAGIALGSGITSYVPFFSRAVAEAIARHFTPKPLQSELHRFREKQIYERLDELADTSSVGIFYGALHLPFIEEGLKQKGYERVNLRYKTALRFTPAP